MVLDFSPCHYFEEPFCSFFLSHCRLIVNTRWFCCAMGVLENKVHPVFLSFGCLCEKKGIQI